MIPGLFFIAGIALGSLIGPLALRFVLKTIARLRREEVAVSPVELVVKAHVSLALDTRPATLLNFVPLDVWLEELCLQPESSDVREALATALSAAVKGGRVETVADGRAESVWRLAPAGAPLVMKTQGRAEP